MTNNYLHIFRRPPLLFVFLMAMTTLVGCGYSIWNYEIIEKKLDNDNAWSIRFIISGYGPDPLPSKISIDDTTSYAFAYFIELREKDTTKYDRMSFRVEKLRYRYSYEDEPIALEKFSESFYRDEHVGATSVRLLNGYGPFLVSMPLPDTIVVTQEVTVFYSESGKELTNFHHVVKAALYESKRSRFEEFIKGR